MAHYKYLTSPNKLKFLIWPLILHTDLCSPLFGILKCQTFQRICTWHFQEQQSSTLGKNCWNDSPEIASPLGWRHSCMEHRPADLLEIGHTLPRWETHSPGGSSPWSSSLGSASVCLPSLPSSVPVEKTYVAGCEDSRSGVKCIPFSAPHWIITDTKEYQTQNDSLWRQSS